MAPTTILLARHGETDWNAVGRWQGHTDRPLTELGRRQAAELAERLADVELDAVYSSDLLRAVETAEPVAKRLGLPLQTLPELREVDVGTWAGLTRDEVAERFPDGFRRWSEWQTGWEDGETYDEMGDARRRRDSQARGRAPRRAHPGRVARRCDQGSPRRGGRYRHRHVPPAPAGRPERPRHVDPRRERPAV